MIYLIDDTPIELVNKYLELAEFDDCIVRISAIKQEDLLAYNDVECVLIHESFNDSSVFSYVRNGLCKYGDLKPLVVFSDGHFSEAKMRGNSYIATIKKSVLYSRLKNFLMHYRNTRKIDLKILAPSKNASKVGGSNSLAELLKDICISTTPGQDGSTTNSAKTYCLGRGGMKSLAASVSGEYIKFNCHLVEDESGKVSHKNLHDFIVDTFTKKINVLYIDTDLDCSLCLCLAMHIRLTFTLPGKGYLCPIVFISERDLNELITSSESEYAHIFLTQNVFLQKRGDAPGIKYQYLPENKYVECFLDRINIPAPTGSNHSIANQWGAIRLYSILTGRDVEEKEYPNFLDVNKELYYKFIKKKLSIQAGSGKIAIENFRPKNAAGKHILLIDDQADCGWRKTIETIFNMSYVTTINERICDYSDFSENAKNLIENRDWDVILLDLRLGGIAEDAEVETSKMSGYKVLRRIKELNRGNQVIILTASNKAWNLKSLLQSEYAANGYFVKESPEYEFPEMLSVANMLSFKGEIEKCFDCSYLKRIWTLICKLENLTHNEFTTVFLSQLKIAYNMAAQADSEEGYQFAYIAINQLWEIITSNHNIVEYITSGAARRYQLMRVDQPVGYYDIAPTRTNAITYVVQPLALYTRVNKPSVWEKIAIIYLQKWNLKDNGILYLLSELIKIRNCLLHIDNPFVNTQNIKETDICHHPYLGDHNMIYSNKSLNKLLVECAKQNLLYEKVNHQYSLHKTIANTSLGVRLQLYCVEYFFDKIISL